MKYVDLNYLKQFAGGDREFMERMIDMFMENTPGLVSRLKDAENDQDWQKVQGVAHKLKSSVDIVGSKELKVKLEAIEDHAKNNENLDQVPQLIDEVDDICKKAYEELKEEKKNIK